jgi:DNA polymerase-3 subunit delta'
MSEAIEKSSAAATRAPWLQAQLESLFTQRGQAWLLSGPSGLGQFELALALAKAWLCETPTPQGACEQCGSCHAFEVRTHADLCVLMPETLFLAMDWPLDQKTQDDLDKKVRKPSKEIKVEAAREAVTFTQFTRSRGSTKVVLVYPAERMNHITANTLLKTLEEPPGEVKFILATEAAHQLLPTIRSRCLGHTMRWPAFEDSLAWLQMASQNPESRPLAATGEDGEAPKKTKARAMAAPNVQDLRVLLAATGGRPSDTLAWAQQGETDEAARHWQALPKAMVRGDVSALSDWTPKLAVDALQKICHDMQALAVGAEPRFFAIEALPPASAGVSSLWSLGTWAKELANTARKVEHPYNPGLMLEALVSRASEALLAATAKPAGRAR